MTARAFLDTNILVYAFDATEPQRQAPAASLVTRLLHSDQAVISVQVLKELFVVLTRKIKKPVAASDARQIVEDLSTMHVVDDTLPLLRKALAIHDAHSVSLWDACIVAAASAAACDTLYTEDMNAGETIHGVTIENPFVQ